MSSEVPELKRVGDRVPVAQRLKRREQIINKLVRSISTGEPGYVYGVHRSAEALHAYEQMEEGHRNERNMEIVLVGADSIETVMLTHGNYWAAEPGAEPAASPYLTGV